MSIIQSVPNLDALHPFYQELSHLLVDKDKLKQNLGRLNGLIPVMQKLLSTWWICLLDDITQQHTRSEPLSLLV